MMVGGTNFVAGAAEVVAEFALHIRFDFLFSATCAGEKNGRGGRLRTLDALRMVVGHLGGEPRQMQRFRHIYCQPCGRRHPHGAAVAVALVGLRVVLIEPAAKMGAIAPVGIGTAQLLHLPHQCCFDGGIVLPTGAEQRLRHSQRHHRVIGEVGTAAEQREILRLIVVAVELVGTAHDVAQNRSVHFIISHVFARLRRYGASSQH